MRSLEDTSRSIEPMLISIEELQRTIGCGKTTAFAIVGRGEIETVKVGRRTLAVVESVQDYVRRLRQARRPAVDAGSVVQAS